MYRLVSCSSIWELRFRFDGHSKRNCFSSFEHSSSARAHPFWSSAKLDGRKSLLTMSAVPLEITLQYFESKCWVVWTVSDFFSWVYKWKVNRFVHPHSVLISNSSFWTLKWLLNTFVHNILPAWNFKLLWQRTEYFSYYTDLSKDPSCDVRNNLIERRWYRAHFSSSMPWMNVLAFSFVSVFLNVFDKGREISQRQEKLWSTNNRIQCYNQINLVLGIKEWLWNLIWTERYVQHSVSHYVLLVYILSVI